MAEYKSFELALTEPEVENLKYGQMILTKMMKLVAQVCQENNVEMMVSCGTLLGAHKFKGWIPWDGDIDLLVKREDIGRLEAGLSGAMSERFWYQTDTVDSHYKSTRHKLRFLDAHYDKALSYPWHGGLQVDFFQYHFEGDTFKTDAPDAGEYEKHFSKKDVYPFRKLQFEGIEVSAFHDYEKYVDLVYGIHPDQTSEGILLENRYPHEGKIIRGACAADLKRYPQFYKR